MSKRMMVMVMVLGMLPLVGPVLRAQTREGITVHGHWVIDVRQSDGTLVSHTEFENALLPNGAALLGRLLDRSDTMGKWGIFLPMGSGVCHPPSQFQSWCAIEEPPFSPSGVGNVGTLQAAYESGIGLVLRGRFTALRTGGISRVETTSFSCSSNVAPAACAGNSSPNFSGTDLPSPVSVTIGQIVQITVTLSFS